MTEGSDDGQSEADLRQQYIDGLKQIELGKNKATELINEINGVKTESQTVLETIRNSLNDGNAILSQLKANQQELLALLQQSKTNQSEIAEIARIADEKDKRVTDYETALQKIREEYNSVKEKVENLLPGATSAALASAFRERKKALKFPLTVFQIIFYISILGFIGLGLWAIVEHIASWNDFLIFALERSPIIVGLVALEEFSRRLYNSTRRLEEDYAYKETISIAFDGYQKAMSNVQNQSKDTLAYTLGNNVLEVLRERPGRLLESEPDKESALVNINASDSDSSISTSGTNQFKIVQLVTSSLKKTEMKWILIIAISFAAGLFAVRWIPFLLNITHP